MRKPVDDKFIKLLANRLVKEAFFEFFNKKKYLTIDTKHPVLDELFPEERRISYRTQGLQTSLGIKLWEHLAKGIAIESGFEDISKSDPILIPTNKKLMAEINEFVDTREKNEKFTTSLTPYIDKIKIMFPGEGESNDWSKLTSGDGFDLLLKDGDKEVAIDIKSPQPNAGYGLKLNRTILKWYGFRLFQKGDSINFDAKIAIPFNPLTTGNWWNKYGDRMSPLTRTDILVEDEFWDFVAHRPGTWKLIQETIKIFTNRFVDAHKRALTATNRSEYYFLIYAERIGCELVQGPDEAKCFKEQLKEKLTWKCDKCGESFKMAITQLRLRLNKSIPECPRCDNKKEVSIQNGVFIY